MSKAMITITLMSFAALSFGQGQLEKAFEDEDAALFSSLFDSQVDMFVMNKENTYSKADAVKLMESFFKVHKVHSFERMHSGSSRGQSSNYEIAHLNTDKGAYRVYLYYENSSGKKLISELRIENN